MNVICQGKDVISDPGLLVKLGVLIGSAHFLGKLLGHHQLQYIWKSFSAGRQKTSGDRLAQYGTGQSWC